MNDDRKKSFKEKKILAKICFWIALFPPLGNSIGKKLNKFFENTYIKQKRCAIRHLKIQNF